MAIQSVGVIGAGQMGNGIAHVFALAGYDVLMTDISREALDKAVALIDRNIERQVSRGKITAEAKADAMKRISTTMTLADLGVNIHPKGITMMGVEVIDHGGALPPLPPTWLNMYLVEDSPAACSACDFAGYLRAALRQDDVCTMAA